MTPRTKAGATWDATVRSAVLDPAVAKMIGADGRQVLLSLVNPDANRDAVRAIEDEMLDRVAAAVGRLTVYRYILPADDETTPTRKHQPFDMVRRDQALAAIEDIRKEASDGR